MDEFKLKLLMNDIQKDISERAGGEWKQYGTSDEICCILVERFLVDIIYSWLLASISTNGTIKLKDSFSKPDNYPDSIVSISNEINEQELKELIKIHKGKLANFQ